MGSYAQARTEVAPRRKGPRCKMCTLLSGMSPEDREAVQADLDNELILATTIGRALKAADMPIGQHVLDRHRRGDCVG